MHQQNKQELIRYGKELYSLLQVEKKKNQEEQRERLAAGNISLPMFYNDKS